jgi:hypothetical protein
MYIDAKYGAKKDIRQVQQQKAILKVYGKAGKSSNIPYPAYLRL